MHVHPLMKDSSREEPKERPHSYSGGLSSADLRRLQHAEDNPAINLRAVSGAQPQQWTPSQFREVSVDNERPFPPEQPTYPSLAPNDGIFSRSPQHQDYATQMMANLPAVSSHEYTMQPRTFLAQAPDSGANAVPHYIAGRPNGVPSVGYRHPMRGFPPQNIMIGSSSAGYPASHLTHLSMSNAQQLYDVVLAHPDHVHRGQQPLNVFRGTHHHSTSDPSTLREVATLALANNPALTSSHNIYAPAIPTPAINLYANHFFGTQ
ncbi:hypothetical protein SERLADRAFT_454856, partial [Serpula lacrymans var. lacrymans S7.9]